MKKRIFVIKSDGSSVQFDFNKVRNTCIRAGATNKLATRVARKISEKIHSGITTRQIYRMVLDILALNDDDRVVGHRYRLKESIMQMGPAGFSFENYVSAILEECNFEVKSRRSIVQGRCVSHEIDITALRDSSTRYMIECKFHNSPGIYTGIKESLYTHARFMDLMDTFDKEMLVCNTKVSHEAITYGTCVGQEILSWRYPAEKGLEKIIEDNGLYPITILGLSGKELKLFSQNNIMLARDLLDLDSYKWSQKLSIPVRRIEILQNLAGQMIS